MDIQQLRYFIASCQKLNYTKAAEHLCISRQALSKAMHELERELGVPLFVRNGGELQITPLGRQLWANAVPVVEAFNELELLVQDWSKQKKVRVDVAIGRGSLTAISPGLFTDFQQIHPEISLFLEEYSDLGVREKVESQQVNIGILSCSPQSITKFDSYLIQPGQLYLQVSRDHPLAAKDSIELADLKAQPFISLGKECDMHNLFVEKCSEAGFAPNFILITQDSNTANNMVLRNQAISFGHIQTLNMAADSSIRIIPLRLPDTTWGTYIITKKGIPCTSSTRILIRYLSHDQGDGGVCGK